MRTFHITSTAFEGYVELCFNESELLVRYDITSAELSEDQQIWFLRDMPRTLYDISRVIAESPSAKMTEVTMQVTFEMFWNKYDDRTVSSKKKTLQKWNKMPESDRIKAYNYIARYFASLAPGTRKKYAETFLNAELWNN